MDENVRSLLVDLQRRTLGGLVTKCGENPDVAEASLHGVLRVVAAAQDIINGAARANAKAVNAHAERVGDGVAMDTKLCPAGEWNSVVIWEPEDERSYIVKLKNGEVTMDEWVKLIDDEHEQPLEYNDWAEFSGEVVAWMIMPE